MSALVIPERLTQRQHAASDPASSIWVSANAGSGKTHVLTQRVMRLLLAGVEPAKVLCLTFTKAAAAEMSARVFRALSTWTALDDADLRAAILATGAPAPDDKDLLLARRLFTRAVETPGGLKIQTIHAFCERLLHLFPFEANVAARFEVADDKRTQEMLSLAKRAAVAAAEHGTSKAAPALEMVTEAAGSSGFDAALGAAMRLRKTARRATTDPQAALAARLGAGNRTSVSAVQLDMIEGGIAPSRWPAIAAAFATGSSQDRSRADDLAAATAAREAGAEPAEVLVSYLRVFFKQDNGRRTSIMTKKVAKPHPDVAAELAIEQDRLDELRGALAIARTLELTAALVALADAVLAKYENAKNAAGLLDFDDLIDRTRTLLERSDAGWVLHKLDAGIDHVLVDEAQDTSEAQWRILERLTGDFAAGAGARQARRSFFVVGDEKQSIFSFQGAAPTMFDEMRSSFERRFKHGGLPFARVALAASFRSTPGILAAVDAMFAADAHRDGLVVAREDWSPHESLKPSLPSLVEIWPAFGATAEAPPEAWTIPLDLPGEDEPPSRLADRVARKIAALTAPGSGDHVHDSGDGTRRQIRPGDVLVLVRTRNAFFEAVIRALKAHHVPVAGADRLDVANHIAVMDLVAAGRAALLSDDDLSLACVLKSPLFGFGDDDLVALAARRDGPLASALALSSDPRLAEAHRTLLRWTERAAGASPFAFYVELLGRDEGRRLMEARLGPEAHDAIDEFLRLALEHEAAGAPSLSSFLDDVEALDSSIKRDMEASGDAVRVMTVHAAKGLEAKVVFLPDTCGIPTARLEAPVFDLAAETREAPLIAWSPRKDDDCAPVAAAREAQRKAAMREYRRLLYVAMTRAEERLYVAGFYNVNKPPPDCWSNMIAATFGEAEVATAFWDDAETILRIHRPGSPAAGIAPPIERQQHILQHGPPWLFTPVAATPTAARRRATRIAEAPAEERRAALAYGEAMHLLLQALPPRGGPGDEVRRDGDRLAAAARAVLAARPGLVRPDDHDKLVAEALAVIALPELALLFSPQARSEVPVICRMLAADGGMIEGTGIVDRLAVTENEVVVADFKTGPVHAEMPADYRRQLAFYRRMLAPLWPGRRLRTLIVWTREPRVVEVEA